MPVCIIVSNSVHLLGRNFPNSMTSHRKCSNEMIAAIVSSWVKCLVEQDVRIDTIPIDKCLHWLRRDSNATFGQRRILRIIAPNWMKQLQWASLLHATWYYSNAVTTKKRDENYLRKKLSFAHITRSKTIKPAQMPHPSGTTITRTMKFAKLLNWDIHLKLP